MQLTYRGVPYHSQSHTIETTASERVGKYRGVNLRFRHRNVIFIPHSLFRLTYRGISHLAMGRFSIQPQLKSVPNSRDSGIKSHDSKG
ncbi:MULTISPECIES: DUF4278 domain-containing protein [unclassified Coleofasciculus]|uniref:DUF4278 domain-containing protein n=1 Tax=unclassified Coleofasciculus TaxID=2692782 RepID=UPI00188073A6|nr:MULTISPECIES: DUF4278 domain-containing protein [unclassified Coleofasciculus]MBE9125610.1 DUF4278 domain-containing protein [Coleofasciculus sp. LEGE 07081]MBE9147324.1 DUF4278 domain-containing protein [Coleofasciculus sp. LEGE 07092]